MSDAGGAIIKVVGVGGGGGNAVDRMIEAKVMGVEFIAMNTDIQVLDRSKATKKVQLGVNLTRGLGAGGDPSIGRQSAEESRQEIRKVLDGADMVFLTAGMGGGTGTGACAVVAEIARELGALTVCIVTKPFRFEGAARQRLAEEGVSALMEHADTLITIPNERLIDVVERKTTLTEAYRIADDILRQGVQGISDIISITGTINVDFADVRRVMQNAGPALMGIGYGAGEHRALQAAQSATSSRLLETGIENARGMLVNITADEDFTLVELDEAMTYLRSLTDEDEASIFFGQVTDPSLKGEVRITVLATGFSSVPQPSRPVRERHNPAPREVAREVVEEVEAELPSAPEPVRETRPEPRVEKRVEPSKIWDEFRREQQKNVQPADEEPEEDLDLPAFLRERKKREGKD